MIKKVPEKPKPIYKLDLPENCQVVAGVDDVGRGPLAGPVMAGAVILKPNARIKGIADSKQLTAKQREELFETIQESALTWAIGRAEVEEIDTLNIFHASLLAMYRAVMGLSIMPDMALIDGKHCPKLSCMTQAIVKGDSKVAVISAASILAKVTRDREMVQLAEQYPQYGFAEHKGYSTRAHLKAIREYGLTPHHRRSFAPVKVQANRQKELFTLESLEEMVT